MKLNKLIYILLSLLLLTTAYGQGNEPAGKKQIINYDLIKNDGMRVQAFTASLDLEDIGSEENRELIQQFREQTGLGDDSPIIVEGLTKEQSIKLGLEKLSDENIDKFLEEYEFKNPVIEESISQEAIDFMHSGELPDEMKAEMEAELQDGSWEGSKNAAESKAYFTKSKRLKNFNKMTVKLTVLRMTFNGAANILASFISTRHVLKSLIYSSGQMALTGGIQLSPTLFEKIMSGKYALGKFFMIESAVISVIIGSSIALGIKDYTWFEYGWDIVVYGGLTTLSQANAEKWAAIQVKRLRSISKKEIIRIANSDLSPEAKELALSRVNARYARVANTFSKVMVGGSMIWASALALGSTLDGTHATIATYSNFAVLGGYALAIKYMGVEKMLANAEKIGNGIVKILKSPVTGTKKLAQFMKKTIMGSDCNSLYN